MVTDLWSPIWSTSRRGTLAAPPRYMNRTLQIVMLFCSCCGHAAEQYSFLKMHIAKSRICEGALGLDARQQHERSLVVARKAAEAQQLSPVHAAEERERQQQHRDETRATMLASLQEQRFGKLRSAPSIADGKALVTSAMHRVKPELIRRLAPMLNGSDIDELRGVVDDICDVFGVMRKSDSILTEKAEMAAHMADLDATMVSAVERTLGWRMLRSCDAEGHGVGPTRRRRSFCVDVPVDATLRRLLQCDARAWEQVIEASARWGAHATAGDSAAASMSNETVLFDIPDGEYFRKHPELGICADRSDGRVRLAFILYWDGLGTTNAIGAFAHKHSIGMFYYALVNLDPSIRMALPYIQLVTVAYESDIKYFGMELIISGPLDEDEETGSSFGACMRRLGRPEGISLSVRGPKGGPAFVPMSFRGWVVLVAADHPAAAKTFGYKEIGAKKPCRGCDWDQGTSAQEAPAAYKHPSSFLDSSLCFWELRTEKSLASIEKNLTALGARTAPARRNSEVLTPAGYKDETPARPVAPRNNQGDETGPGAVGPTGFLRNGSYFHGGLHSPLRIPLAPKTAPQDLMHTIFEGIAKLELAAFLYMAITKYSWFTLLELNAAIASFDWGRGAKPDDIQPSALEGTVVKDDRGKKSHRPKIGCHVHYHSGVMKNFMLHSERFLTALLTKKGLTTILDGSSAQSAPWHSWLQLVKVTVLTLKYSYTMAEVKQLDQSIIVHQRIFTSIPEYELLYKPKHHFTTHLPQDIIEYGPLRHFWCFRFEALNQLFKKIAQGSNYMNLCKREADYWCYKSACDYKSGKISSWGLPQITSCSESQLVERFAPSTDPSVEIIFRDHFPLEMSLMVTAVEDFVYSGDTYSRTDWILINDITKSRGKGKLAQILAIWEVHNNFFLTAALFDMQSTASSITLVNTTMDLPLPFSGVRVLSATSTLMQPVRYKESADRKKVEISLLL